MSANALSFTPNTLIEDAAAMLATYHMGGAPVVDGERVVGVLSKTDLLNPDRIGRLVGDMMTPLVISLRPDEPAMAAVRLMLAENIHRIMVMEEMGKLAGIVTTTDVLKAIHRGYSFQEIDDVPSRRERYTYQLGLP